MKTWKYILGPLIVVIIMSITACSSSNTQTDKQLQQIEVTRGDLTKNIHGSGKISLITDAKLSFGSGGRLFALNVKENDKVTSGQVLAQLDTTALEVALAQARVNQSQALLGQSQAKSTLDQAKLAQAQYQTALDQAKLAQIQANASLTTAQYYLDQMKPVGDIENTINQLQTQLDIAQAEEHIAALNGENTSTYEQYAAQLKQDIAAQQLKLSLLLKDPDYASLVNQPYTVNSLTYNIMGQTYDRLTVENIRIKELAVESAQKAVAISESGIAIAQANLDQSSDKIAIAQTNLDQSGDAIALAQKNIDYIQKQINDSTITPPFNGTIAALYYKQGDIIPSPAVTPQIVIYLVDTDHFEVSINIDELDSPAVQIGQDTIISVNAFPGSNMQGKVSSLSSTPNTQVALTGGTSYAMKVAFEVPQGLTVKSGMTASVDIISSIAKNVLLLPSNIIKKDSSGNTFVQILMNQNVINQPVTIGLSSGTNTQIISGLNEGDKVISGIAWSELNK